MREPREAWLVIGGNLRNSKRTLRREREKREREERERRERVCVKCVCEVCVCVCGTRVSECLDRVHSLVGLAQGQWQRMRILQFVREASVCLTLYDASSTTAYSM